MGNQMTTQGTKKEKEIRTVMLNSNLVKHGSGVDSQLKTT